MYARSLNRLALVFACLYVLLIVSSAFPPKLLDYEWINGVSATLINGSSMPLLALLILVVGSQLYPEDQQLQKRLQLFSRLAGVAVIAFLLLIPLHIFMGAQKQIVTSDLFRNLDNSERQLVSYRQAVNQAASSAELQMRLKQLGGPEIRPEIMDLPLPQVKAQLSVAFNQLGSQIAQQRQALSQQNNMTSQVANVLRIIISALLLAFGYSAFVMVSPTGPLLINNIEEKFTHIRLKSLLHKGRKSGTVVKNPNKQPLWWRHLFVGTHPQAISPISFPKPSKQHKRRSPFSSFAHSLNKQSRWWRQLLATKTGKPTKIRKRKRSSKNADLDYLNSIIPKNPNDS